MTPGCVKEEEQKPSTEQKKEEQKPKEEEQKPSTEYKKEEYLKPKEEEYKPSTEYKRTAFPLEKTPQALLQYQNDKHQKEKGEEPFFAKGTCSSQTLTSWKLSTAEQQPKKKNINLLQNPKKSEYKPSTESKKEEYKVPQYKKEAEPTEEEPYIKQ